MCLGDFFSQCASRENKCLFKNINLFSGKIFQEIFHNLKKDETDISANLVIPIVSIYFIAFVHFMTFMTFMKTEIIENRTILKSLLEENYLQSAGFI